MRTQEEIKRQIEGLEKMKTWLPEYSGFGDPNHYLIIDSQISILDGSQELSDIEEGDWEEMDEDNKVYPCTDETNDGSDMSISDQIKYATYNHLLDAYNKCEKVYDDAYNEALEKLSVVEAVG